jgi:DNA (cytosine-5)-methyltransferase 1
VDNNKKITHLSLCSGYEGIGLGLRSVLPNLREIAYVEREGFCVANLVAKMEAGKLDAAPVFTDVKTFPYGKFLGKVSILSGGFPCQPFSAAGKRQATEDPRHLFPYIADGIRECQPRIVFLENVQGILSCKTGDGEPVLQYVLRELEGMGYRATAGIFSAEEVGAPHQRKRVYILGAREEMANNDSQVRGRSSSKQPVEIEVKEATRGSSIGDGSNERTPELAYSNGKGLEGVRQRNYSQGREASDRQLRSGDQIWPSRPGKPQYEWEEPRVVADSKSQQGSSRDNGAEPRASSQPEESQSGGGHSGSLRESNGQAKPQLGRTSNGSTSRVDRLRLLGNGVVPQTAAKAFVTLINRLV